MKLMINILICVFALAMVFSGAAHAAVISSVQSGDFIVGSTWDGGVAPNDVNNEYVIENGHTVYYLASDTYNGWNAEPLKSLTINSGGTFETDAAHSDGDDAYIPIILNGGTYRFFNDDAFRNNVYTGFGWVINSDSTLQMDLSGSAQYLNLYLSDSKGSQVFSGSGNLNVVGTSTGANTFIPQIWNQWSDATYSGDWTVSGAIMNVNNANSMGTGGVILGNEGQLKAGAADSLNSLTSISLTAASSIFDVATYGWNNESATLTMSGGTLNLGSAASVVGSMSIGGNALAADIYDAAELAALGYGGTFEGTGTIEVVPEPTVLSVLGLFGFACFLGRYRKRIARPMALPQRLPS